MRATLIALTLFAGGCTLFFGPDRDFARMDGGGVDGGLDASFDAGPDAGPDSGPDAGEGCPGSQGIELSCGDMMDDDCNGFTDCEDAACRFAGECCLQMMGATWLGGGDFLGNGTQDGPALVVGSTRIDFNGATFPQAVVYNACAPLAFGMSFSITFEIDPTSPAGDYAALKLSPVATRAGMGEYISELTVRVTDSGEVRLERAGALIDSVSPPGLLQVRVNVDLRPGFDEARRGTLLATVRLQDDMFLAQDLPFIPFELLRGPGVGCDPDGLFVVVEGQGSNVEAITNVSGETFTCENPNQFTRETSVEIGGDLSDRFEPSSVTNGNWRLGGVGEPTVLHLDRMTERLELWGDASTLERDSEDLRVVDFVVGATRFNGASWSPRLFESMPPPNPVLFGPDVREPTLTAPRNNANELVGGFFILGYAEERDSAEVFDIFVGRLSDQEPINPVDLPDEATIEPLDVGCTSLRDPSLAPIDHESEFSPMLLFFTCERAGPDSIGVARLDRVGDGFALAPGQFDIDFITSGVGEFGAGGVSSPEAVTYPIMDSGDVGVRLWFLSRDSGGEVAVSTANGLLRNGETLPEVTPYPANPVLRADDPVLGGGCSSPADCSIDSLAVTRTAPRFRWGSSYLMVVAHTRQTVTGPEHVLVPLVQRRPNDE